ncbi:tetratricopeptide repeat protein [Nevskia soli]|uniref:tetratricopeptide repeat protein n=1 Tax=Nevskia soli TaxID=418856 RepID=UPI0015D69EE7|nr:tetratricopeptide repeat protein [Nevskia soli]
MISLLRSLWQVSIPATLAVGIAASPLCAQNKPAQDPAAPSGQAAPKQAAATEKNAATDRASAYYNFSMGHLYAEMAQAYNRQDYVNKAIDFYRLALKQDPSVSFITEELTDLYIQSGQLNKAVTEAEDLLKRNPDDLGAHRVLGRVYTRLIGDPQGQQGKIDEKMLQRSIEQYAIIAQKDPDDTESALLLARLYRLNHDTANAEKSFKAVIAKESDNDEALTGLAGIYSERGDTKQAIDLLKRSSDENPTPRTLVTLAQLYEQSNDYGDAANAWQGALELAPDNDRWRRALAQDLLFSDRLAEARKLYEALVAEDPHDAVVQLRLSELYLQQHEIPKSRAAWTKAHEADPDNLEVKYDEVALLDAEGKTDDAIKAMKSIIDSSTKPEYNTAERAQRDRLIERLGNLYRSSGKYQQAIAAYRDISPDDSENGPRAEYLTIETYRQMKDMAAARRESDAAMKKYPKDRLVVIEHATLLADGGQVDRAINEIDGLKDGKNDRELLLADAQLLEKAKRFTDEQRLLDQAEQLSTTTSDKITVRFARGAMLEKMKDFDGAEAAFRAIIKDDPDNAGALNYLGYMLADRDQRLDEAQKLISKALEIDPQNGAYLDSLGWVYYRQNLLDNAESNLRLALERMGNDPTVHDHLGDVLMKEGKVKEAIAQWQSSLKSYDEAAGNSDTDPADMAKVQRKLEDARVRVARQGRAGDVR